MSKKIKVICAIFPFSSRKSRHGVITPGPDWTWPDKVRVMSH